MEQPSRGNVEVVDVGNGRHTSRPPRTTRFVSCVPSWMLRVSICRASRLLKARLDEDVHESPNQGIRRRRRWGARHCAPLDDDDHVLRQAQGPGARTRDRRRPLDSRCLPPACLRHGRRRGGQAVEVDARVLRAARVRAGVVHRPQTHTADDRPHRGTAIGRS